MNSLDNLASAFNILQKSLPGYEDRPQQIEMAREVSACLGYKKRLIVEAGTGVGKSFAYLIPAILSGKKTIVSTATIALQDQLANKDLVFLQEALPQRFSFAILKGKNNYLCLKREREFAALGEPYKRFGKWVSRTKTGDRETPGLESSLVGSRRPFGELVRGCDGPSATFPAFHYLTPLVCSLSADRWSAYRG